jgi:hypothetical protein
MRRGSEGEVCIEESAAAKPHARQGRFTSFNPNRSEVHIVNDLNLVILSDSSQQVSLSPVSTVIANYDGQLTEDIFENANIAAKLDGTFRQYGACHDGGVFAQLPKVTAWNALNGLNAAKPGDTRDWRSVNACNSVCQSHRSNCNLTSSSEMKT